MPAIEIEVHWWRPFKRYQGAIQAGFISIAWRLNGIMARLHKAMEELRAVARGEDR